MAKIIVAGDSIAYGKWDSNGGWVTRLRTYIDKTYNIGKRNNFQVYNLGIPGEIAPRLAERFEGELDMRIPSVEKTNGKNLIILAIGINDSCSNNWLTSQKTSEEAFKDSIRKMIDVAQDKGCRVAVIGLTPVNPSRSNGLLFSYAEVEEYDKYLSDVCEEKQIAKLELLGKLESEGFSELLVDVVHPNDEGHSLLTEKIIDFLQKEKLIDYLTQD